MVLVKKASRRRLNLPQTFFSLSQFNSVCHRSIQLLTKVISFAGRISLVIQPAALAGSTREKTFKGRLQKAGTLAPRLVLSILEDKPSMVGYLSVYP